MAITLKSIHERPKNGEAIVLVGLPGSGKSTWAANFKYGYPVLSSDRHIEELALRDKIDYAESFRRNYKEAIRLFRGEVEKFRHTRESFIWDQMNATRAEREIIYKILSPTHKVTYVCFLTPFEECLRRLDMRKRDMGPMAEEKFLRRMADNIEYPQSGSGEPFDHLVRITHPDWRGE